MKLLSVTTALLFTSVQADINQVGANSLCGFCIASGWTYCQKNEDFPYATHDDFLYLEGGSEE